MFEKPETEARNLVNILLSTTESYLLAGYKHSIVHVVNLDVKKHGRGIYVGKASGDKHSLCMELT